MALKDMLSKKTDQIEQALSAAAQAPRPVRRGPATAPGDLLGVRDRMNALEAQIERFDGSAPTRRLDPKSVRPSPWANRHADSFRGPEFEALKADIAAAGVNVQPIKVRPAAGGYEIVFGHRRHRACLDLGLEVSAVIESLDDQTLFAEMDRENRAREDLRPYESAVQYKRALDQKLWSSQSQLAAALGVTQAHVSQLLSIAELERPVIEAFASPLEIQVRWGVALAKRQREARERLLAAANRLAAMAKKPGAAAVFATLMGDKKSPSRDIEVKVGGKRLASIKSTGDRVTVSFSSGSVGPERLASLERLVKGFLAKR